MKHRGDRVDGVLLLDKPAGISSNAALQRARRALNAGKAGHTGTLDPLATGLLPVCLGEATKFAQFLLDAHKRYRATVRFGVATDTLDAEGAVVATRPVALDAADIAAALPALTGAQLQIPPAHSALKHRGRAHYHYARAGEDVPRVPRAVEVMRLTLLDWRPPDAIVDVECGKGTYVRVLAADLGERLGCGAHLAALRRTATGGFDVEDAIGLDRLEALDLSARRLHVRPVNVLIAHLPRLDLATDEADAFVHGRDVAAPADASGVHAVFAEHGLIGVADARDGRAQPRRVLAGGAAAHMQAA
ncbi:MAG TPA: tRNA pseudouridine(55) synthase TruB [Casimicrobiaceae bacterium]